MIKIQCENQICNASFYFDEMKNQKAKKVMCPKCKTVQPLVTASAAQEEENSDADWLRRDEPKIESSPNIEKFEPLPAQVEVQEPPQEEDWFNRKNKVAPSASTPPRNPKPTPTPQNTKIGWLVIHDEFTETFTFDLKNGMNRIGMQSNSTTRDVNIAIRTEDKYMSRQHCEIEVRWLHGKNRYEYILSDKGSSNGTFVNAGRRLSHTDEVSLTDGDTLQIGRTKVVLKLPSTVSSSRAAQNWVESTDYLKTIIQ